jgi:hypothetical protein
MTRRHVAPAGAHVGGRDVLLRAVSLRRCLAAA